VLKGSGFDQIWTVDPHSEQDRKLFPLPLESLFPCAIFRESRGTLRLSGASFVSPDQGAIPRCRAMMSAAGIKSGNVVYFEKHRTASGLLHHVPVGKVERCAVIVDDILDSGATLVSACENLAARRRRRTLYLRDARIVHRKGMAQSVVASREQIFCTDTIPACANIRDPRITVLPVAPVLREGLLRACCKTEAAS
jgi:ribose-phosphate pyrophosphokinase